MAHRHPAEREFAVIGLGRMGASLARGLADRGCTVFGIDVDMARVQEIADEIAEAAAMDATSDEALLQVDIPSFQTVIVAISDNFEATALITASLKRMGVARVIAQAKTDRHKEILQRIGADRVIRPYEEMGERLAEELGHPHMTEYMNLGGNYALFRVTLAPEMLVRDVADVEHFELTVVLVTRADEIILNPGPGFVLQSGDICFVLGTSDQADRLLANT